MIFGKMLVARIALSSSKNMPEGGRQGFAEKPRRPHGIVLEFSPYSLTFRGGTAAPTTFRPAQSVSQVANLAVNFLMKA